MRCVCAANVPARMIAVDPNTAVFLGSRCLVSAERYRYLVTRTVVGCAKNATTADRNVSIYDTSTLFQTTRMHGSGCRLTCRSSLYLLVAFKHCSYTTHSSASRGVYVEPPISGPMSPFRHPQDRNADEMYPEKARRGAQFCGEAGELLGYRLCDGSLQHLPPEPQVDHERCSWR